MLIPVHHLLFNTLGFLRTLTTHFYIFINMFCDELYPWSAIPDTDGGAFVDYDQKYACS